MSTVEDLINQVTSQDFAKAGPTFNELLNMKLTDALEAEKIKISNQVYNGVDEEEEDDIDMSDEDMEEGDESEEDEVSEEEEDEASDDTEEQ